MSAERLFVYGTLRPGQRLWPQLAPMVRVWGPAQVEGFALWSLPEGYPALLESPGAPPVCGAVLELWPERTDEALRVCDALEGVHRTPPLYLRVRADILPHAAIPDACAAASRPHPAWIYIMPPARRAELARRATLLADGGDWLTHASTSEQTR